MAHHHDAHGRVFRAPQQLGPRRRVPLSRIGKALLEIGVVIVFPTAIWAGDRRPASAGRPTFFAALVLLLAADSVFSFYAVMAHHDAGAADRRHDLRHLHADRRRDRRLVWALFLGLVWYRTLDWRLLIKVSMDTIETTATVLLIVAAASIFGWLLTVTRVTDAVAALGARLHAATRRCSCCLPTSCCCSSAASSSRPRRSRCSCRSCCRSATSSASTRCISAS